MTYIRGCRNFLLCYINFRYAVSHNMGIYYRYVSIEKLLHNYISFCYALYFQNKIIMKSLYAIPYICSLNFTNEIKSQSLLFG